MDHFLDYEITGLENIPKNKSVLIIFYHSLTTLDFIFAASYIYLKTGRKIRPIVERSMLNATGINFLQM